MVLFFTVLLALSIAGMVAMLWLKRYELATGRVVLSGVRPLVGTFVSRTLLWAGKIIPALVREQLARAGQTLRVLAHRFVAQSVLWFERTLEKVLHTVREKTGPPREPGEASAFLREVADHKKKLIHRSRNTIVEE
ncbi:MAG: hypothetical protein KGH79_00245 [Patescibacteria group bacterium]|nr:hypothetical protein [Patescibacteria group bacterium]